MPQALLPTKWDELVARVRAVFVTDDRAALKEQLEAVIGERITALEAVEPDRAKGREAGRSAARETEGAASQGRDKSPEPAMEPSRTPKGVDRGLGL